MISYLLIKFMPINCPDKRGSIASLKILTVEFASVIANAKNIAEVESLLTQRKEILDLFKIGENSNKIEEELKKKFNELEKLNLPDDEKIIEKYNQIKSIFAKYIQNILNIRY